MFKKKIKKIALGAVMAAIFATTTVSARTGDVVGHIYTTDIYAYMNDIPVSSYNIGGKTAVILEDVTKYHPYDNNTRTLTVSSLDYDNIVSGALVSYGDSGSGIEIGNIYETDIKTYVCGKQVTAYNIGGKTAVALEDLGGYNSYSDIGCKYNWDNSTRTIRFETRITIEDDYGSDYEWHSVWESRDDDDDSWYYDDDDDDNSGWYDDGPQYLMDVCPPYDGGMKEGILKMSGKSYGHGLGMVHSEDALVNLDGYYSELNCIIGHPDDYLNSGDSNITFYVDGKVVKDVYLENGELPLSVSVPLKYGRQLKIHTSFDKVYGVIGIAEITVE